MYEKMLDPELFNYFKCYLDDDTRYFWEELFKHCSIEDIRNNLFRNNGFIQNDKLIYGSLYAKFIAITKSSRFKKIYDTFSLLLTKRTAMDKLYAYCNVQAAICLQDLPLGIVNNVKMEIMIWY